jgi:hypothetical protein
VAVAAAAFGIATAVQAGIPDANGVIHGCYYRPGKLASTTPRLGALRVIDTAEGRRCAADEKPLDWNATATPSTP